MTKNIIILSATILLIFVFKRIFDSLISKILKDSLNAGLRDRIIHLISGPLSYLAMLLILKNVLKFLNFQEWHDWSVDLILSYAINSSIVFVVAWLSFRISDVLAAIFSHQTIKDPALEKQFVPIIKSGLRIIVISIAVMLILQNIGYSIASLVTGLGIGGLVIALAAQETLSNFFSSVMILTNMPFRVGDRIRFQTTEGKVELIGFWSTKIRTLEHSLVIIPNRILTSVPLENFSKRDFQFVEFDLMIDREETIEKVKALKEKINTILHSTEGVDKFQRFARISEISDTGVHIRVHYHTTTLDIEPLFKLKEHINILILEAVANLDIKIYQKV